MAILTVKQVMKKDFVAIGSNTPIKEAAKLLAQKGLDWLPVVDEKGRPVAVLAPHILLAEILGGANRSSPVSCLPSCRFAIFDESAPLDDLRRNDVDLILVTGGEKKLAGLMTRADLEHVRGENCWMYNQQLQEVLNSIPSGLLAVDARGMVTLCNGFAEKLLGLSPGEAPGRHLGEIMAEPLLLRVLKTGKSENGGKEVIKNISVIRNRFPVFNNGVVVGAVEVFQNVSDLDAIAHELQCVKALSQELEGIIESSYDGIVVTDGKGKLLRFNRSYSRISGIPWEELVQSLGRNMADLVASGEVSSSVSLRVIKEKKTVTMHQRLYTGKDLMVTGNPVFNEEGKIVRVVCNIRDTSMLNQLKREIEANKQIAARYCEELEELRARNLQLDGIIAQSAEMKRALDMAIRVASVDSTVLITGETGTGKEVIAKVIHKQSKRKDQPFITVNCGAIPETLLESELFGYEKGAFSGASREGKPGLLEVANKGTVFLDEIGDLPLHMQVKLLRVLQDQEIFRVGGTRSIKLDLRILAATNKDLARMVEENEFREDFFYRLNVIPIHVPPLRERREDIIPLAIYFLEKYGKKHNLKKKFSPEVLDILEQYHWPGNVRELENLVERLMITSPGEIVRAKHLPGYLTGQGERNKKPITIHNVLPLKEAEELVERELLARALSTARTTRKAASILGVDHSTIVRKMNKYKIGPENRVKSQ